MPLPEWQCVTEVGFEGMREIKIRARALQAWLGERVAKWMIPDRVLFVDAIPRTGVGKFLKRDLREKYKDLLSGA